jgi:hypothetical protein
MYVREEVEEDIGDVVEVLNIVNRELSPNT